MKINELLEAQQVDEISLAGVGKAIGKGADAAGQAVGGVASGAVNAVKRFGQGLKKGWQGTSAAMTDPAAGGGTAPAASGTAPAASGSAPAGSGGDSTSYAAPAGSGGAPAANGGGGAPAAPDTGSIGSIMQTIDKLDKPTKQQLAGELEKNITATPDPKEQPAPTNAPTATPTPATEPAQWPAGLPKFNSVTGQKFASPEEAEKITNSPEFKQQMADVAAGKDPSGVQATQQQTAPAPTTAPASTTPASTTAPTTPPAGGKMTQAQQDALKAKLQGQRQAGKTTATQTGSGFKNYVDGSQTKLAGADASGAPVFKKLQRESVAFSKFLGVHI